MQLHWHKEDGSAEVRVLAPPGVTLGRWVGSDIRLPAQAAPARPLHAAILYDGTQVRLRHLASGDALRLNGQPLAPGQVLPLRAGDQIAVGSWSLQLGATADPTVAMSASVPLAAVAAAPVAELPVAAVNTPVVPGPAVSAPAAPPPAAAAPVLPPLPETPPVDVFADLLGPDVRPVGSESPHPFALGEERNPADPLSHLQASDVVRREAADPLHLFAASPQGEAPDLLADGRPTTLASQFSSTLDARQPEGRAASVDGRQPGRASASLQDRFPR